MTSSAVDRLKEAIKDLRLAIATAIAGDDLVFASALLADVATEARAGALSEAVMVCESVIDHDHPKFHDGARLLIGLLEEAQGDAEAFRKAAARDFLHNRERGREVN